MELKLKQDIWLYNDEIFNEIYNANTLVNVTRTSCREREFKGEYYGVPENFIPYISNERNEYLSMLTLISDKINHIYKLSLCVENELTVLNKYTNNSSR